MMPPLFSLMMLCCFQQTALPQEMQIDNGMNEVGSVRESRAPILLSVPCAWIANFVNCEFENKGIVNRVILGTTSVGTSNCKGKVTSLVEENPSGVSILCTITGTVESRSRGTNGPAIISSTAITTYTSTKRLTFDGKAVHHSPASVSASTHVTITNISSSLPRLRGRFVIQVANKRAQESLSQVELIVNSQTERELSQRIDVDFEAKINNLNYQIASSLPIINYFTSTARQLQLWVNKIE